jgi:hypothetical protein
MIGAATRKDLMAGHTITPYELTATRKFLRDKSKKDEPLILASLSDSATVDLLTVIEKNVLKAKPSTSSDKTRETACVAVRRKGDIVTMVFACDISGEREVVRDAQAAGRPVVFTKGQKHIAQFLSICMLWRPAAGTEGVLLIHSPWGRGGSKAHILGVLQRAVNADSDAKAKLHADPKVPADVLEQLLQRANATKVTYTRRTGITSDFAVSSSSQTSTSAEMELVVRGADSVPFRDAFTNALKRKADRSKLFTVQVRDGDGGYEEQRFDDVEVEIQTGAGKRTYSMARDTIPTMGFDLTGEINAIYYTDMPDGAEADWPETLLENGSVHMKRILDEVK